MRRAGGALGSGDMARVCSTSTDGEAVILPRLDEKAAYILDGISKSLDDLKKLILA
jgi:hypothetical protein